MTSNAQFYKAAELQLPFIVSEFGCQDGRIRKGLFLIDTGSTHNILNDTLVQFLKPECFTDTKITLSGVNDAGTCCSVVNFTFSIGRDEYTEEFSVTDQFDFSIFLKKNCVIGILGTNFLRRHGLVLDFQKSCLHDSEIDKVEMDENTFLFPMDYGFQTYRLPIVGIVKGEEEFLCIADSGCNLTTLSQKVVSAISNITELEGVNRFTNLSCIDQVKHALAEFTLLSMSEGETGMKTIDAKGEVNILANDYIATSSQEGVPPICGLIGSEYMMAHGWVLDYKAGYIYSTHQKAPHQ